MRDGAGERSRSESHHRIGVGLIAARPGHDVKPGRGGLAVEIDVQAMGASATGIGLDGDPNILPFVRDHRQDQAAIHRQALTLGGRSEANRARGRGIVANAEDALAVIVQSVSTPEGGPRRDGTAVRVHVVERSGIRSGHPGAKGHRHSIGERRVVGAEDVGEILGKVHLAVRTGIRKAMITRVSGVLNAQEGIPVVCENRGPSRTAGADPAAVPLIGIVVVTQPKRVGSTSPAYSQSHPPAGAG